MSYSVSEMCLCADADGTFHKRCRLIIRSKDKNINGVRQVRQCMRAAMKGTAHCPAHQPAPMKAYLQ